jgi:hypothetical protein
MRALLWGATWTRCGIAAAALTAALALSGCGCDDEDSSATAQNCQVLNVDNEQYTLCCTLTCNYHYDDNGNYSQTCTQLRSCATPSGAACPPAIANGDAYPPCPY